MTEFETNVVQWFTDIRDDLKGLALSIKGLEDKFNGLPCGNGNCPAKINNQSWKKWLAFGGGIGLGLGGGASAITKLLGGI